MRLACNLAGSTGVGAFQPVSERAAREALAVHPGQARVEWVTRYLADEVEADPARLIAVRAATRRRHSELDRQGEPPERLRRYLLAVALVGRALAMIQDQASRDTPGGDPPPDETSPGALPGENLRLIWVMRLPRISPPFTEDRRDRDGCMLAPLTWRQRALRQVFPRRGGLDCCLYHQQDLHKIAAAVSTAHRQLRRVGVHGGEAAEALSQMLIRAGLSGDERGTATRILSAGDGIHLTRLSGQRDWTYESGRHRARALMDAGVRRIPVTITDENQEADDRSL